MKNNLSAARRNAFMHILPDAGKVKNADDKCQHQDRSVLTKTKDLSKKRVINLYDVVIENEYENNFDLADIELPDFSHGYKNHIPIWQD